MNGYEHDKLKPGPRMLSKLANAFGVTVEELADSEQPLEDLVIEDADLFQCFPASPSYERRRQTGHQKLVQAMVIKNQVQTLGRLAG